MATGCGFTPIIEAIARLKAWTCIIHGEEFAGARSHEDGREADF
jgi:hypothetical protein